MHVVNRLMSWYTGAKRQMAFAVAALAATVLSLADAAHAQGGGGGTDAITSSMISGVSVTNIVGSLTTLIAALVGVSLAWKLIRKFVGR